MPITPLYLKYDRFLKMKAFRYKTSHLREVLQSMDKPEYNHIKRANLIDILIRKLFTLQMEELNYFLTELMKVGGFIKADAFLYVFQILKRFTAEYEYYKTWRFQDLKEVRYYANIVHIFVSELHKKYMNIPQCIETATDFAKRSSLFWSEQIQMFDLSNLLWISNSICKLNSITPVPTIERIKARLTNELPEIKNSGNFIDLKNMLEIDAGWGLLSPKLRDEITAKTNKK